jgi:hypothetical protein
MSDDTLSAETVATKPEGSITEPAVSGLLYAWQSDYEAAYGAFLEAAMRVDHQHLDS